jgi:hypothetical protein
MKYSILIIISIVVGCSNSQNQQDSSLHTINPLESKDTTNDTRDMNLKSLDTVFQRQQRIRYNDKWKCISEVIHFYNKPELKTTRTFYSTIAIKDNCDKVVDYYHLDSIQIESITNQETLILGGTISSKVNELAKNRIEFVDLNFDGYYDLSIYLDLVSGDQNSIHRYFLYNPNTGSYRTSLDLTNIQLDTINKIIKSHSNAGHAGMLGHERWMDFVGFDSLRVIKHLDKDLNREIEAYIYTTKELIDSSYVTKIDTIPFE